MNQEQRVKTRLGNGVFIAIGLAVLVIGAYVVYAADTVGNCSNTVLKCNNDGTRDKEVIVLAPEEVLTSQGWSMDTGTANTPLAIRPGVTPTPCKFITCLADATNTGTIFIGATSGMTANTPAAGASVVTTGAKLAANASWSGPGGASCGQDWGVVSATSNQRLHCSAR